MITHRLVKQPRSPPGFWQIIWRQGSASALEERSFQGCKYRSTARVVQHADARLTVAGFLRSENRDVNTLLQRADSVRSKLSDSDFEADQNQHNADYIARFAKVFPDLALPDAALEAPGRSAELVLNGVRVTTDIHFRLRRTTRTNKIKLGAAMLRYAKGKALPSDVGEWQSAYLFGYLQFVGLEDQAEPERKLCITIDAYSAAVHAAPSDSINRFHEIEATCATIAERWPNIGPPPNAILTDENSN